MSVNIGEAGEEAMIFYRDPMELMAHLADKHGTDAVTGMAELIAWKEGTGTRVGPNRGAVPPKTIDEMYACATNESERRAIHETLFGSAMGTSSTATCPTRTDTPSCAGMLAFPVRNHVHPWIQRRVSGARRPRLNLFLNP